MRFKRFLSNRAELVCRSRTRGTPDPKPANFSTEEAYQTVQAFMYHASSHIVAAARLSDQFLDTFGEKRAQ